MIQPQRFQPSLASINIDRNTLALALFLAFFSVLLGCDNSNSNNDDIAEEIAQQTQAFTQTDHIPSEQAATNNPQSEPTTDDMVTLASMKYDAKNSVTICYT